MWSPTNPMEPEGDVNESKKEVFFSIDSSHFHPRSDLQKEEQSLKKHKISIHNSRKKKQRSKSTFKGPSHNISSVPTPSSTSISIPTSNHVGKESSPSPPPFASSLPTPASLLSISLPKPPEPEDDIPEVVTPSNPSSGSQLIGQLLQGMDDSSTSCFKCPFCDQGDFSESTLFLHVMEIHPGDRSTKVLCPICVSQPGGNKHLLYDLHSHLRMNHKGKALIQRHALSSELISSPLSKLWIEARKSPVNTWTYIMHMDIMNNGCPSPSCCLCLSRTQLGHGAFILPCAHVFHSKCIENTMDHFEIYCDSIPKCPYCELTNKRAKKPTKKPTVC